MGCCFLVALSHAYYYVHECGYFVASVCISLPRSLKQVFKLVETHAKKMSHRRPIYV